MEQKYSVSVRGGFSDRNKIKPLNEILQIDDFDERTRIQLINFMSKTYAIVYEGYGVYSNEVQDFLRFVLGDIYSVIVDARKDYSVDNIWKAINITIKNDSFSDVLTVVEACARFWDKSLMKIWGNRYYDKYFGYNELSLYDHFNDFLKSEYIGYRFIDGFIVPIVDDIEIEAIEEAINNSYDAVKEHISKANFFLGNREHPDYENSIKESISAVEAMCKKITDEKGGEATLGRMLKKLENEGINIHPALKNAFLSLYGYTSDANGIRHAGNLDGPSATFDEAKFMLVSCSAFINYLMGIQSDHIQGKI